jgi:hypothetical protein
MVRLSVVAEEQGIQNVGNREDHVKVRHG